MDSEDKLLLKETFSPIKVFTSPSKNKENQENYKRLETILSTLITNHGKWEAAQSRGSSLCVSIEAVKSKAIEEYNRSPDECTLYPESLKDYCDKLKIILGICEDVVKSATVLTKQFKSLVQLNKQSSEIFCKTWSLQNFQETAEKILDLYQKEFAIKETIATEIAHCTTRRNLLIRSKLWQYPEYTDNDLKLLIMFIQQEIKDIIKIS